MQLHTWIRLGFLLQFAFIAWAPTSAANLSEFISSNQRNLNLNIKEMCKQMTAKMSCSHMRNIKKALHKCVYSMLCLVGVKTGMELGQNSWQNDFAYFKMYVTDSSGLYFLFVSFTKLMRWASGKEKINARLFTIDKLGIYCSGESLLSFQRWSALVTCVTGVQIAHPLLFICHTCAKRLPVFVKFFSKKKFILFFLKDALNWN